MDPTSPQEKLRQQLLKGVAGNGDGPPPVRSAAGPTMHEKYAKLSLFCIQHPRFISSLATATDVKVYDELQDCLGSLCTPKESLEIIKSLLREEFELKASKEPGSILRGASLAAKMSSRHARSVGTPYLKELLSAWIEGIKELPELSVQTEADKVKLLAISSEVIEIISRDDNVAAIPADIRELARLIGLLCDQHLPEQKWPLVGGLMLLRLYCPTIISPTTYGLLDPKFPMSTALRKNLMQVTRLLQNASNHQPFKDGPNVALNPWVEAQGSNIDTFLEKVIAAAPDAGASASGSDDGSGRTADQLDRTKTLKLVQLYVQHKNKLMSVLDNVEDEDFKPLRVTFSDLLSACGNPFRTRTGTVAKASQALTALNIGNLASKRVADLEEFQKTLAQYRFPMPYIKDYFATTPPPQDKTIKLCALISNDKHGVPCAPKVGKKENHLVFVGRDGVDWLVENLNLTDRPGQCLSLMQEMVDLGLVCPWQTEKKDKKGGVRFEDGDRFFWFDYAAILGAKPVVTPKGKKKTSSSSNSSSMDDREMKANLASLQLEHLGRAGILDSYTGSVEAVSSREQWRMLLQVAFNMTYSPSGVIQGATEKDEAVTFDLTRLDRWTRLYLGFKKQEHSEDLCKNLCNDGFVSEKESNLYVFNWQKIKQWHEKTFSSKGARPVSSPPTSARDSKNRMSLRGGLSRLGSRNSGVIPDDGGGSSGAQGGHRRMPSQSSGLRKSTPAVSSAQSLSSSGSRIAPPLPPKKTASSPRKDDESSSLEERNSSEEGNVSMLDFLNQDPDDVKAELDESPPQRPTKLQSKASLKNLFSKKDKDSKPAKQSRFSRKGKDE